MAIATYNSFGGSIGPFEAEYNRQQSEQSDNRRASRWPNGSSTHPNDSWVDSSYDPKPAGFDWFDEVQKRAEEAQEAKERANDTDYYIQAMELIRRAQEAARHQKATDDQNTQPQPSEPVQPQPSGRRLILD